MERDLKKAIQEYDKRFNNAAHNEGAFYAMDCYKIKEMSKGNTIDSLLYDAISNALKAGFMIGYRKAQRDARKNK